MIIEGKNAVSELLKTQKTIDKILVQNGMRDEQSRNIVSAAKELGIKVSYADKSVLDKTSKSGRHQGFMAFTSDFAYADEDEMIEAAAGKDCFFLLLDGIEDPHNLGSIIRVAECAGIDGIFIGKVDQGQRDFNFRLTVAKENELKRNADEFTEKPYALNVFPTIDEKDDNGFKISSENADISFVTLKKARQVKGYVMRLQNNSEKPARDRVSFGDKTLGLDFGKYEVKTVVYDGENLYEIKDMII